MELLRRGWRVVAVDRADTAIGGLMNTIVPWHQTRLRPYRGDFCAMHLPAASLIVASFSLPIIRLARFLDLWHRMFVALKSGGRFAGQLLGPNDSWVRSGRCHGFNRRELAHLCRNYRIEWIEEERTDAITPRGQAKHWHLWHLNLRKP